MPPKTATRKQKAGCKAPAKTRVVVRTMSRPALDVHAIQYAKLLMDPCNGPVVHPVYAGSEAGFLFRAESVFTLGTAPSNTAGVLHWTPGYPNNNATELVTAVSDNSNTNTTALTSGNGPGRAFLLANAYGARCVAACLRAVYPGSEANRSGRLHYGHTQASFVDAGDGITVDGVAVGVQNYTRTPPEAIEVVWRPGVADQEFNDPNAPNNAIIRDRKSALTVAWAGLPAGVGMTFHLTAIYEWTPKPNVGVATNPTGKNPSRNTLDHVIDTIQDRGFKWAHQAGVTVGSMMGTALVGAMSGMYGRMSSRATRRPVISFR